MSRKFNIEFFQNTNHDSNSITTTLDEAYNIGSIKQLVSESGSGSGSGAIASEPAESSDYSSVAASNSSVVSSDGVIQPEIQTGTLWHFLGIDNISLKNKHCIYNCGIDTLGCMERCSNPTCREQDNVNYDQCKFGCIRKGLSCTTNCSLDLKKEEIINPHQTDRIITQPILTNKSLDVPIPTSLATTSLEDLCEKHYDIIPNEVSGVYANLDTYAPFDMRVWPKNGKFGWTIDEINRLKRSSYDSDDVIEVSMSPDLYPIKNDKPILEFDYLKK